MTQRFRHLPPVVPGDGIGVYALARQLHEVINASVMVVASDPIVAASGPAYIIVVHQEAGVSSERTTTLLRELAQGRELHSAVLMANVDVTTTMILARHTEPEPTYAPPSLDIDVPDAVSGKTSLSRLCTEAGVLMSRRTVVDLVDLDCMTPASADELGMEFLLVVKAVIGADYDYISLPGKRKIWFIDDTVKLVGMWRSPKEAGYRSIFLVQERIPGDDTAMRPMTVHMDSIEELCLIGLACVLLQDHAPAMTGDPVAMMTEAFSDLREAIGRLLCHAGYHGFANLDIKVDSRDGRELFFEVNPRIGRNSFYLTAVGASPMAAMLEDLVLDQRDEPIEVTRQALYSLVPDGVTVRYMSGEALRRKTKDLGRGVGPLRGPAERSLHHHITIELRRLNHYRKSARNYPR